MTTNANAPVETRHKDEAKKLFRATFTAGPLIAAHAQSLANLEAANNRLAEIDRIAVAESWTGRNAPAGQVAALAAGHTPSPCPGCAAKDEAMEAMRADLVQVGEIAETHWKVPVFQLAIRDIAAKYRPPADPLAEALKAAWTKLWPEDTGIPTACQALRDELVKHGLELSRLPLGGAK